MICQLCLEKTENCIEFDSYEGKQLNVAEILIKHFSFCFESEPYHRVVCRKCWWKMEIFNEFYEHIRTIRNSVHKSEEIFATEMVINPKGETDLSPEHIENNISDNINVDNGGESKDSWAWDIDQSDENNFQIFTKLKNKKCSPMGKERGSRKNKKSSLTNCDVVAPLSKPVLRNYQEKIFFPDDDIFRCNQCELTFLSKNLLYFHIKRTHQSLEFRCPKPDYKCVESFKSKKELDEHTIKYHTQVECSHCHKSISSFYMNKHIKLHHDESRHVVCDQCGIISSNSIKYRKHFLAMHTERKKLQCDICKSMLVSKTSLRTHMTVQHVWKAEKCQICGRILANRKMLLKHHLVHDDILKHRYKCTICGRGFRDNFNLKEHVITHSNKEYPCDHCTKLFKTERTRKKHMKNEHTATNSDLSEK